MVIDTSCLAAIFFKEPERQAFLNQMEQAQFLQISAATALEAGIVIEGRLGTAASGEYELFLVQYGIQITPVDAEQVVIAQRAWREYGKGNHPAALNFGDCFSYALAKISGEPLLAKGNDFRQTDIELC
ncbi:MAG TPA: type II toxin-antitoxin system VapC family toxin [Alloacidobacterium sp.]|nr:type II toxin-antitoxin system VapC family toxin [Alloacidobacterium sp.]